MGKDQFSYLSDPQFQNNKWKRNIYGFNINNSDLRVNQYIPIPLSPDQRKISIDNFQTAASSAIDDMKNNKDYWNKMQQLLNSVSKKDIINIMCAFALSETATGPKWSIWDCELHRYEPHYHCYSVTYFHILLEKDKYNHPWPWLRAKNKLRYSFWECYDSKKACSLFLAYCFEKHSNPLYFFSIDSQEKAKKVGKTYNGARAYWIKLRNYLKTVRKKK